MAALVAAMISSASWAFDPKQVDALNVSSLDGQSQLLAALRGRVSIVTLWATWCFPCRYEMPLLEKLARELRSEGLAVIAIALDDDLEAVRQYQAKQGFSFSVVYDAIGASKQAMGVTGVPATFVLDRDGHPVPIFDPGSGESSVMIDNPLVWSKATTHERLRSLLDAGGVDRK